VEEEVAAVEDDEVVHKGSDKKGRVLWVMSHTTNIYIGKFFHPFKIHTNSLSLGKLLSNSIQLKTRIYEGNLLTDK
jgi:hypothetical protein